MWTLIHKNQNNSKITSKWKHQIETALAPALVANLTTFPLFQCHTDMKPLHPAQNVDETHAIHQAREDAKQIAIHAKLTPPQSHNPGTKPNSFADIVQRAAENAFTITLTDESVLNV